MINLKCVGIKSYKTGSNKEGFDNYLHGTPLISGHTESIDHAKIQSSMTSQIGAQKNKKNLINMSTL